MLVRVKRGSIAILRTMGATPQTIVRAFFLAAAAVGLVGTAVGTALGLLICANMPSIGRLLATITGASGGGNAEVDFITSMPVRVQAMEVGHDHRRGHPVVVGGRGLSGVAHTRVEPVEGLRYQ